MADFTATANALAALDESAGALLAYSASTAAKLATAQTDLSDADANFSAQISTIRSKLDAGVPTPAPAAAPTDNTLTLDTPAPAAS